MWIRSQDNELVNLDKVSRISQSISKNDGNIETHIIAYELTEKIWLGSYVKTKRALEVLDEIEGFINGDRPVLRTKYIDGNPYQVELNIYTMPKE